MASIVWPTALAYRAAIRDADALADPQLATARVEIDEHEQPRIFGGTTAATFRFRLSSGSHIALRCYVREIDRLERRYEAIGEYLRFVHKASLCRTNYLAYGVRVDGRWWPAIEMEWAAGRPLGTEIEARLGNAEAMLQLAQAFRTAVRELAVLGIAHGDLQQANVLVGDRGLRFIGYDAMFVPALAGLPQAAYGHPDYQHPDRARAAFDARLDHFSSIVIYTALVALAADPSLWTQFGNRDRVLFRAQDFASNGRAPLFRALLSREATRGLAGVLLEASNGPIHRVPGLETAIDSAGRTAATRPPPAAAATRTQPQAAALHERLELIMPRASERPRKRRDARVPVGAPAAFGVTALVGLAIGIGLAESQQHPGPDTSNTTHTTRVVAVVAEPTMQPAPVPTLRLTPVPALRRMPEPTVAPTPIPTPLVTPAPLPGAVAVPARSSALQGTWQISEANVQVGPMLWAGGAALTHDGTLVINAHKVRIDGHAATPCERATSLQAAVPLGRTGQTVAFQETNCAGTTSTGEVRITAFAPDERSFSGTFYENGVRLGAFTAAKR